MANTVELKDFRKIILDIGNGDTQYLDVSKAILDNLNPEWKARLDKKTQQNILNASMEEEILNMMKDGLPRKFDYERHSFAREVTKALKQKWVELF